MRWIPNRHKQNAIESKAADRFLCNAQMSAVDGIERPSEQADSLHASVADAGYRRFARNLFFRRQAGEFVAAVIVFMRRVALRPLPLCVVRVYQVVQYLP